MSKLLKFVTLQMNKNGTVNSFNKQGCYFPKAFYNIYRGIPGRLQNPKVEAALRKSDKIPPEFKLIYRSTMTNYVYCFYPLSILSYALVGFGYYYFKFYLTNISYPISSDLAPVTYKDSYQVQITMVFYLVMNTFTLYLLRRTPIRIWLDSSKGEYRMILIRTLPPFKKQLSFKSGEVTRKHMDPRHSLQEISHRYKRRFYNITMVAFRTPADYYDMVGYSSKLED
ncbi:uncharacterized protein LOC135163039 [Diachasmimorpha longicaudata]|uniref:uncharacterized protein LOC135163039 n=1 Tax=Diachasmimorpha longicaudata TaxID=58733 RepID=UPI0030B8A38C